jgi:hypothetical protein
MGLVLLCFYGALAGASVKPIYREAGVLRVPCGLQVYRMNIDEIRS